jgi:hypothetical protein
MSQTGENSTNGRFRGDEEGDTPSPLDEENMTAGDASSGTSLLSDDSGDAAPHAAVPAASDDGAARPHHAANVGAVQRAAQSDASQSRDGSVRQFFDRRASLPVASADGQRVLLHASVIVSWLRERARARSVGWVRVAGVCCPCCA